MARKCYTTILQETRKAYLPWEKEVPEDDKTWYEHRKMTEGVFQEYQDLTSKIKVGGRRKGFRENKDDERAEMDMKLGESRKFLLSRLGVGWNAVDEKGTDLRFTAANIMSMPPEVIKEWIDDIYDFNPVLKGEEVDEDQAELGDSGNFPKED